MRNQFWLVWLMVGCAGLGTARAEGKGSKSGGTLVGHLTVTAPARPAPPPAGSAYLPKGSSASAAPAQTPPEQVVLFLKNVKGKYKAPRKHAALDQKFLQFTCRVLPVLRGTTVDFTNHDPVYHNVFTNSQTNPFDLGRKRNGETVSVKMNHAEVPVKVYCEIHSKMKSYILVLDNPFFTTTEPGQDYEITGIPPGTYTLAAWHDYWSPVERRVKIKRGKTTRADVTLDKVKEE